MSNVPFHTRHLIIPSVCISVWCHPISFHENWCYFNNIRRIVNTANVTLPLLNTLQYIGSTVNLQNISLITRKSLSQYIRVYDFRGERVFWEISPAMQLIKSTNNIFHFIETEQQWEVISVIKFYSEVALHQSMFIKKMNEYKYLI